MPAMRVNHGALALYGFGVLLLYLAGTYFGSFFTTLFYLSFLYPGLSFLLTAAAARGFSFSQSFEHREAVKGQRVGYRLLLRNGSLLPLHHVAVHFTSVTPLPRSHPPDIHIFLGPRKRFEKALVFRFPFRGRYLLGADRIEGHDFLHLFTFVFPVETRSFTVYPRIQTIDPLPLNGVDGAGAGAQAGRSGIPEYTLFSHLREYRQGESLRHVSWKKFASYGTPSIKEFDSVTGKSANIFVDLRRPRLQSGSILGYENLLELEDTSVEIAVALVKQLLERRMSVSVTAAGREIFRFSGNSPEKFTEFYRLTPSLSFRDSLSPALLQRLENPAKSVSGTSIFVSHLLDREMISALERCCQARSQVFLVYNRSTGLRGIATVDMPSLALRSLRSRGIAVLVADGADGIRLVLSPARNGA